MTGRASRKALPVGCFKHASCNQRQTEPAEGSSEMEAAVEDHREGDRIARVDCQFQIASRPGAE